MPEHSAEFLRGAYKIATRYAPMDVAMQINADLFEAEAHETTHPTAADVIAECKRAFQQILWYHETTAVMELEAKQAIDKLAAWEAAQNAR